MSDVMITATCIGCDHTWPMTEEQIAAANELGMAQCPKCGMAATAENTEATEENQT